MSAQDSLQPLVDFYLGVCGDHADRHVDDVLAFDDDELESNHDYIQWLFPLRERSIAVPASPVIDDSQVGVFRCNLFLQVRVVEAFDRMLAFYGLVRLPSSGDAHPIARLWTSADCRPSWIAPRNHNLPRVTRILKSLRLLGLDSHARAFFRCLESLYREEREAIGEATFGFWVRAARG